MRQLRGGRLDRDSGLQPQHGSSQTARSSPQQVSAPAVPAAQVKWQACSPEHALQQVGPIQWGRHIKDHAPTAETHLSQRLARHSGPRCTPWQLCRCRILHQRTGCVVQEPLQLAVCSTGLAGPGGLTHAVQLRMTRCKTRFAGPKRSRSAARGGRLRLVDGCRAPNGAVRIKGQGRGCCTSTTLHE